MQFLSNVTIESLLNLIDAGKIVESFYNYRNRSFDIDMKDLLKSMLSSKGYTNLTPPQATNLFFDTPVPIHLIDLRDAKKFEKSHIIGAVSKPIDDFLGDVYQGVYSKANEKPVVLICDTGHISRVAAAALAEEGIKNIYSISGGMRRWNRWMKLSQKTLVKTIQSCCTVFGNWL